jgi:hypothetical protein
LLFESTQLLPVSKNWDEKKLYIITKILANDYSDLKKNVLLLLSKVLVKLSIGRLKKTMREVLFSKHLLK